MLKLKETFEMKVQIIHFKGKRNWDQDVWVSRVFSLMVIVNMILKSLNCEFPFQSKLWFFLWSCMGVRVGL